MRKLSIVVASCLAMSVSAVNAKKAPELTPMELQSLQSREFETPKEVLFASVVSVFQDLGYQLDNADMPSGFITATSANKNKTNFLDALSYQRSSGNTRVTAFVEQMPNRMARVRLNFLDSKTSSGVYGQGSKKDKQILDPVTYKVAWDKIDEALFVRSALNSPAKTAMDTSSGTAAGTQPNTSTIGANQPK